MCLDDLRIQFSLSEDSKISLNECIMKQEKLIKEEEKVLVNSCPKVVRDICQRLIAFVEEEVFSPLEVILQ
jgi:hypothetical protein